MDEDNIHLKTSFMRFWICLNIVLLIGSRNESFSQNSLLKQILSIKNVFVLFYSSEVSFLKNVE